jgi:anti-sigma B factor antagonist
MTSRPHLLSADSATLRCSIETRGTTQVVCAEGEIDLSTASQLRDAIRAGFDEGPETLVIDLSGVTFADSTALHALLDADRRALAAGMRLAIVPAPEPVQGPFRATGLESLLPFVPRAIPTSG